MSQYDVSSIKVIWCGAAPLSKEVEDAVKSRIGVPIVRQGYGMTEGTLSFTGQTDLNHKSGSVGILRTGVWGRVIDVDTGKTLKTFEKGELLFKGSCIMKGYIDDVKATENTIDKDGWLHTGDIGYYDNDGELFIVDRLKELIKYKGWSVCSFLLLLFRVIMGRQPRILLFRLSGSLSSIWNIGQIPHSTSCRHITYPIRFVVFLIIT